MLEVKSDNFEQEVMKSDKPVLVDFWAPWCMPCKILTPTVERVADEMKDTVKVCKLDVDESPDIATDLAVMNIPTLIVFKGGQEVGRIIGVNSKEAIEAKIRAVIA